MAIIAKENLGTDANGKVDFSIAFPQAGTSTTLAAGVEQTVTVPSGYNRAFFSYSVGTNVFVSTGSVAAEVPGAAFATTNTELNPSVRQVLGGETLRFISPTVAYVQISFRTGAGSV